MAERSIALKGHEEVTECQQDCAEQDRLALPNIAISQIAADDRRDIDERGIGAIDERRLTV